jgi:maltose O-acetyltransferase
MTAWEKLLEGQMYNDFDEDLFQRRIAAKKLFRAYNRTEDEETELRQELMRKLFKSVGKNVWIEPDFRCEFGKNISIEENVYLNFGGVILDCAEVFLGANTLIGPNLGIYAADHAIDAEERIKGGCIGKPVRVGRNVWLGGDVKILAGVTIGDNTIIGSGSVVTKSIPANVIAAGNPCRVLRPITEKDKTDYLKAMHEA